MFPCLTRDEVFRIETRRLWLRWPRLEDAAVMAPWIGLPEVATMTSTFKVGMTVAEVAGRLEQNRASNASGKSMSFVMTPQGADDQAIGMLGVHVRPDGQLELGYHLDPTHWGQGLMTEAVRALAVQVFELAPIAKIDAGVKPANPGSIRVLEKCGFKPAGGGEHESPLYGRYLVHRYALARSKPSSLLAAQQRFGVVPPVHALCGLV